MIQINSYSGQLYDTAVKNAARDALVAYSIAESEAESKKAAMDAANEEVATCQTALDKAISALAKKEQDAFDKAQEKYTAAMEKAREAAEALNKYMDKLSKFINELNAALEKWAEAQAALAAAVNDDEVKRIEAEIDRLNRIITNLKHDIDSRAKGNPAKKYIKAKEKLAKAAAELNTARDELNAALANIEELKKKSRKVQSAIATLEAAKEKYEAAKAEYDEAATALIKAKEALDAANEAVAFLEELENDWTKEAIPSLLKHEEEHRQIAYFYLSEMTYMLESLRAWGFAPKEARAKRIGMAHYNAICTQRYRNLVAACDAMQSRFDAVTNHNEFPDRWNHDEELPSPSKTPEN